MNSLHTIKKNDQLYHQAIQVIRPCCYTTTLVMVDVLLRVYRYDVSLRWYFCLLVVCECITTRFVGFTLFVIE